MSRLAQARARNRHEAGEAIDREVMETMLATLSQKLNLLRRLKLEVELGQRVAEKNMAEISGEGGVIIDEFREVVNAKTANFRPDVTTQK